MGKARPLPRGYPGTPTPQKRVDYCLSLRHPRSRGVSKMSYRQVAQVSGHTASSIWRWDHTDMTPTARSARSANHGHRRLLPREKEAVVAGWIVWRSFNFFSTTSLHLRAFLYSAFGIKAKWPWISKFARRNHLSWRRPERAPATVRKVATWKMAIGFLSDIHDLHLPLERIFSLDKTSLYTEPLPMAQLGPKGSGTLKRTVPDHGERDDVYTCICADGTIAPFYVATPNKKIPNNTLQRREGHVDVLPKGKNRGTKGAIHYIEWALRTRLLVRGDLLITDQEEDRGL